MLLLILALPIFLLLRFVYLLARSYLSGIPSPFLARFSQLWKIHHALRGTIATALVDLHVQYGPVVRIAPNEVSVVSAEDIGRVYGGQGWRKDPGYYGAWKVPIPVKHPGHFPTVDPVQHAKYRRPIAQIYTMRSILNYEEFVEAPITDVLTLLDGAAETPLKPFNVGDVLHFFAYEIVFELTFGGSFGFLKKGEDVSALIDALHVVTKWGHLKGQFLFLQPFLNSNFGRQVVGNWVSQWIWHHHSSPSTIFQVARERVRTRFAEKESGKYVGRGDMLDSFMEAIDPDTGKPLSEFYVTLEAMDMLGAGSDTTASALRAAMFMLLEHPEALARSRAEITDLLDAGKISFPLSYNHATKLEYTQACIKEALRLIPANGATLPRVVPDEGAVIQGTFLKAGTVVGMSLPLTVVCDQTVPQSELARAFASDEMPPSLRRVPFFPLPRCGRQIDLTNVLLQHMAKLVPTIILNYDFCFANPDRKWTFWEGWFNVQTDFLVYVSKRAL